MLEGQSFAFLDYNRINFNVFEGYIAGLVLVLFFDNLADDSPFVLFEGSVSEDTIGVIKSVAVEMLCHTLRIVVCGKDTILVSRTVKSDDDKICRSESSAKGVQELSRFCPTEIADRRAKTEDAVDTIFMFRLGQPG